MLFSVVRWFATSRVGQALIIFGAVGLALLGLRIKWNRQGYREAIDDVESESREATNQRRRTRIQIDRDLRRSDTVRERLRRDWARD